MEFYIRHCILYDYFRFETSYFCCYTWLSIRKSVGTINEIFYAAQEVDQYAFGHLFLSTFAWLYYHYHSIRSVFGKQPINSLPRVYRLHLYFFFVILQLFLIQWILLSCRIRTAMDRCFRIFPSFYFFVDQSFDNSASKTFYQVRKIDLDRST